MADAELENFDSQAIWVDLYEAAEITGFSLDGMRKLASRIGRQPEGEREINIRKRTSRWEIWLPDLLAYVKRPAHGPRPKRDNLEST